MSSLYLPSSRTKNVPHYHAAVEMAVLGINVFHGLPNESVLFSFIILTVLSF